MKKFYRLLLLLYLFIPISIYAYSDYIIAGGDNIGIRVNMDGIIVIGTYDINGISPASIAGLKEGDKLLTVDNHNITSIEYLSKYIKNTNGSIVIGYERNGKKYETKLEPKNNKTGLYLKDSISGIGTLTFIDPETHIYGALGHEIVDTKGKMVDILNGNIYSSKVLSVTKSSIGSPGEKNATLSNSKELGSISKNTIKGIYGTYNNISYDYLYKVGKIDDIKLGKALIKTVIENDHVEEFDIKILEISETKDKTKNIVFEITDQKLLDKTGGVIQGMSGSPIIQNGYIVGAVTHVIVSDPKKGYGILITNMLEEAERE